MEKASQTVLFVRNNQKADFLLMHNTFSAIYWQPLHDFLDNNKGVYNPK